jgi:predicted dehydrogenase
MVREVDVMGAGSEEGSMDQSSYGIIGGGWRAEFYLRIAQALPQRFRVRGMMVRDGAKGQALEARWGVHTYRTLDELLEAGGLDFVVVSVPWPVTPVMLRELARRGMPALSETPPAPDLEGLIALHELTEQGARIQVAEQYPFQPLHAARLAIARSGKLGQITQAQVSAAHGYHGMSLIRQLLGITFQGVTIWAREFASPIVAGPGRGGPPTAERITTSRQTIAYLDFGNRLGVYDFTGDQYFSWIRSDRVLVRGDRGEIKDHQLSYLRDFQTPIYCELTRVDAGHYGNLEGYYHKGILAGGEWVYENPFVPARLTDDEIAVATCLDRMAAYAAGGSGFYDLPQASQDHYLSLLLAEAVATGEQVVAEPQPWASL